MYTYVQLCKDVKRAENAGAEVFSIGASGLNRQLYCFRVGSGVSGKQVIISGGIHAREHVSSYVVMRQLFYALKKTSEFSRHGRICFIPMLNPDGNMLCYEGLSSVPLCMHEGLVALNKGSEDFSLWKANAFGVDLNVNFDAKWGTGKHNVLFASSENYIGKKPLSEPESRAVVRFTRKIKAVATVSYHAKGQELYWEFGQSGKARLRDRRFAEHLNSTLKYKLVDDDHTSAGGYKDYCIQKLGIPSLTIELVDDRFLHPLLDYSCAYDDILRNLDLPIRLLAYANKHNF